jgi:CxxC motif-containing protein (DUF1111 family)
MNDSPHRCWRLGLVVCSLFAGLRFAAAGEPAQPMNDTVVPGEAIFVHNWARPQTWTQPEALGVGGDGLGPVFNEVSCVACHSLGGVGGAGGNEHNVELLSVVIPPQMRPLRRTSLLKRARRLHPELTVDNLTVMLHRYGFGPSDETFDYDTWRAGLVETAQEGQRLFEMVSLSSSPSVFGDHLPLRLSQRNTPALWGMGEIERLRRSGGDQLRQRIAIEQSLRNRGVSGRLPRTIDGSSAWFGWRGHVAHLPEFVLNACANELGLAVNNRAQPPSPLATAKGASRRSAQALDLTNSQVIALVKYVETLPRPGQQFPTNHSELDEVYAGEKVFEATGCAECHVPNLAFVKDLYSDLLLHDMGESLADPVSAFPEEIPPRRTRSQGSYSGGSSPLPTSGGGTSIVRTQLTHEWRTPPLWGVADSPPYLHDGRAATLEEAIRLHDGEGRRSADSYRALAPAERSQLLTFLGTLRAPQIAAAGEGGRTDR